MAKKCDVRGPWYLALALAALPATAHAEIREGEPRMESVVAEESTDAASTRRTDASLERDNDAWKVTKCAAAITVVVVSVAVPVAKVVKLRQFVIAVGGVREAARLLVGATTFAEKARVIGGAIGAGAAEILSIDAIITNC